MASRYMQLRTAPVPQQALPAQNLMSPAAEWNSSRRFAYAPNSPAGSVHFLGPGPRQTKAGWIDGVACSARLELESFVPLTAPLNHKSVTGVVEVRHRMEESNCLMRHLSPRPCKLDVLRCNSLIRFGGKTLRSTEGLSAPALSKSSTDHCSFEFRLQF